MVTTAASYRKPQADFTVNEFAQITALEADLAALCDAGVLEAFTDEHGVLRYRPLELARVA